MYYDFDLETFGKLQYWVHFLHALLADQVGQWGYTFTYLYYADI